MPYSHYREYAPEGCKDVPEALSPSAQPTNTALSPSTRSRGAGLNAPGLSAPRAPGVCALPDAGTWRGGYMSRSYEEEDTCQAPGLCALSAATFDNVCEHISNTLATH
jgi:hypothetical protein